MSDLEGIRINIDHESATDAVIHSELDLSGLNFDEIKKLAVAMLSFLAESGLLNEDDSPSKKLSHIVTVNSVADKVPKFVELLRALRDKEVNQYLNTFAATVLISDNVLLTQAALQIASLFRFGKFYKATDTDTAMDKLGISVSK